jgi:hypothetical protein
MGLICTTADWQGQICDGFRQPHIRPAQRPREGASELLAYDLAFIRGLAVSTSSRSGRMRRNALAIVHAGQFAVVDNQHLVRHGLAFSRRAFQPPSSAVAAGGNAKGMFRLARRFSGMMIGVFMQDTKENTQIRP